MPADDPKIDPAQLGRDSEIPIRPEPSDGGIPAGQLGKIENNTDPGDADADESGVTAKELTGSHTDTVRNAVSDLDDGEDDQPDSGNPNDCGQD